MVRFRTHMARNYDEPQYAHHERFQLDGFGTFRLPGSRDLEEMQDLLGRKPEALKGQRKVSGDKLKRLKWLAQLHIIYNESQDLDQQEKNNLLSKYIVADRLSAYYSLAESRTTQKARKTKNHKIKDRTSLGELFDFFDSYGDVMVRDLDLQVQSYTDFSYSVSSLSQGETPYRIVEPEALSQDVFKLPYIAYVLYELARAQNVPYSKYVAMLYRTMPSEMISALGVTEANDYQDLNFDAVVEDTQALTQRRTRRIQQVNGAEEANEIIRRLKAQGHSVYAREDVEYLNPINQLIREIANFTIPTPAEIVKYFQGIEELAIRGIDSDHIRQEIASRNMRLVFAIAKGYTNRNHSVGLLDLISEGGMGLLRATEDFDWRDGAKFGTYASNWIRQGIMRHVRTTGLIPIPVQQSEASDSFRHRLNEVLTVLEISYDGAADGLSKLHAHIASQQRDKQGKPIIRSRLTQTQRRNLDEQIEDEITRIINLTITMGSKKVKVTYERMVGLINSVQVAHDNNIYSLNAPVTSVEGDNLELGNSISDHEDTIRPYNNAVQSTMLGQITALMDLAELDEMERLVMFLRAGIGVPGGKVLSLAEIGRMHGVTREWIRQVEAEAKRKLLEASTQHEEESSGRSGTNRGSFRELVA